MAEGAAELLKRVPIFSDLDDKELGRIASTMKQRTFQAGDTVTTEGQGGVGFFVIEEGRATVESRSAVVRELGSGDFFGEIALLRDVPRTATVRALTPLRLLALDRSTFIDTVTGHAASVEAAGSVVAARLRAPVGS